MTFLAAAAILFFGVFTQTLSGFGIALVAMPLLTPLLGIKIAAPLVALLGTLLNFFMVIRFRTSFNFTVVWKLSLFAFITIPLGVYLLDFINQKLTLFLMGIIVILYSLYALLNLKLPALENSAWIYGAGFFAGLLGGMFNTNGPPVIIYGHCRKWSPTEFKVNLQGFFLMNNFVIIASHIWRGNITPEVITYFGYALPALILGILAGLSLDKIITPVIFQKVVLFLLLAIGLRLLV